MTSDKISPVEATTESITRRAARIVDAVDRHVGVERGLDGKARKYFRVGSMKPDDSAQADLLNDIQASLDSGESVVVMGQAGETQIISKTEADKLEAEGALVVNNSKFGVPSIAEHYKQFAALNGVHLVYGPEVSNAFRSKMQVQLLATTFYQAYRAGMLAVLRLTELSLTHEQVAEEIKTLLVEAETMLGEKKHQHN